MADIFLDRVVPATIQSQNFTFEFEQWLSVTVDTLNEALSKIQDRLNNLKINTTGNIGGAGAGPISVVASGLAVGSPVTASIVSSSNPVSIIAIIATATGFDVTFSADPGASIILNYIAGVVAQ